MSVYFYHLPKCNLVKIGTSVDVSTRIKTLSTGCTEQGYLIRVLEGFGFKAERWLHTYFKGLRVKGEWFKFSEEMLTVELPVLSEDTLLPSHTFIGKTAVGVSRDTMFNLSSNQNATWLFWLLDLNRDIKTNIAVIEPSTLSEAEIGKLKRGYKSLEELNIVRRVKNKHYLVNPKAIIPLTKHYPEVVAHWFQVTGAQP